MLNRERGIMVPGTMKADNAEAPKKSRKVLKREVAEPQLAIISRRKHA